MYRSRMHAKKYWMQTAVISLLSCMKFCDALIKHCDPNTVDKANQVLQNHPGMKSYIDSKSAGRLGTITLVNWQDPVLFLKSPDGKECSWKMESSHKVEMDKFNKKNYQGSELHADPVNAKAYYRLISCERKDCIQYYNVFVRPIATPTFPVQIYHDRSKDIKCDLKLMQRSDFKIKDHQPPFRFEWTGPKDCVESHWNSGSSRECVRYKYYPSLASCASPNPCTFKLDKDYLANIPEDPIINTENYGYKDTTITITEWDSTLRISKASEEHDGKWRCIVYDSLNISSHPDDESLKLLDYNGVLHRGIVDIHCKNFYLAAGIPGGIIVAVFIIVIVSILFCKQCPDYAQS